MCPYGIGCSSGGSGPRGIATLVFGLLAFVDLEGREADVVVAVMAVTVVASIVAHGLSTGLIASRYGRTKPRHRPVPLS